MARAVYSPFDLVFKRLGVQCQFDRAFSRFWRVSAWTAATARPSAEKQAPGPDT
jgi:hypothetical protein